MLACAKDLIASPIEDMEKSYQGGRKNQFFLSKQKMPLYEFGAFAA